MERLKEVEEKRILTDNLTAFKNSVAFFPGRFEPAHKGHIQTIKKLSNEFDKVLIGIGSCYESGTERHPICAHFREKIILLDVKNQGINKDKIDIVHLQDFPGDDNAWIKHIMTIACKKGVTHFVTGNRRDILDMLERKEIKLPFVFVNPEEVSEFNYHAEDMRNAVMKGDYEAFENIASFGTVQLMSSIGGFGSIREAVGNNGIKFIHGRQTVDIIFTISHKIADSNGCKQEKVYFLGGRRLQTKKNFHGFLSVPGGGIDDYESPINAVLRELKEETGIEVLLQDNTVEPSHVLIKADNKNIIGEMRYLGLFGSEDEKVNGKDGGSSQGFHIHINEDPEIFKSIIRSDSDLEEVDFYPISKVKEEELAFQQREMLQLALSNFNLLREGL